MSELEMASAFASVVGLLINFKGERSGRTLDEFMSWMRERHHEALAHSIDQHDDLKSAIAVLLAINHQELVGKLQALTTEMQRVAMSIDGFAPLVLATSRTPPLSAQALSILDQMVRANPECVMSHDSFEGTEYLLIGDVHGPIDASEPRHLKEDFDALVALGHLRMERASRGSRRYYLTRSGIAAASAAAS